MASDSSVPGYSVIYAFGDSLSDAGNLSEVTALSTVTPASPPYFKENYGLLSGNVFSNGPTWVQNLSVNLGLGTLAPSLLGGTDFAFGGAETGLTPQNDGDLELQAISLPSQLVQFQTRVGDPQANALYTLSIGSNDLLDILADTGLTPAEQTDDVNAAITNEIGFVDNLLTGGARNLLVLDVPDLGKTPFVMDGLATGTDTPSAAVDALASNLASEYDNSLTAQLAGIASAEGVDITVVDAHHLIDDAVADPGAYGLTNVTMPVWSGSYSVPGSGTLAATGAAQDQYLFFDHLHPTETGQLAVAALAEADLAAPCFAAGTRIATARGAVRVQDLRVGDLVVLEDGATAPVVWLGHRRVDCSRHPRAADVHPVRIAANAFGLGRPHADVRLSPDHAVYVDGVLIPVRYLLNDATVRQEQVDSVEYWHVELPAQGVLLADGLPAESYLDTGNRGAFANGGPIVTAHPDFARGTWWRDGVASLVTEGPARDTVYRRLLVQAMSLGWRPVDAGDGGSRWLAPSVAECDAVMPRVGRPGPAGAVPARERRA